MGLRGYIVAAVGLVAVLLMAAGSWGDTSTPAPALAGGQVDPAQLHKTLAELDDIRALGMRGLMKAQDLKCVYLYGRGFGLDMPEDQAEELLLEGLDLHDYLYGLDITGASQVSYLAAEQHPHLAQEHAVLAAYLSEAAAKVLDYHKRVSQEYDRALAQVKQAADKQGPTKIQEVDPVPVTDQPIQAMMGDGFRTGWTWPILPVEGSTYHRYLVQHHYDAERLMVLARQAGLDFVRPDDINVFEWADVETAEGKYDFSRIDQILAMLKKYDMPVVLPITVTASPAPQWLVDKLGSAAGMIGADGKPLAHGQEWGQFHMQIRSKREKYAPANLFNTQVSAAHAKYVEAMCKRAKESGVRIHAVYLLNSSSIPKYAGPEDVLRWRAWLKAKYASAPPAWGKGVNLDTVDLPALPEQTVSDLPTMQKLTDMARWREQEYIDILRPATVAIRSVLGDAAPIMTRCGDRDEASAALWGRNDERLAKELKLVPYEYDGGASVWDRTRRAYSAGHFSAAINNTGSGNSYAQYAFSSYMNGTFQIETGPMPIMRGFYWSDSFPYMDMRWRGSALNSWTRYHQRAQGMGPEMLNTVPRPQVAMLWSDTSNKAQAFIRDFTGGTYGFAVREANYHRIGCQGWDRMLDSLSRPYNMVTEEQARQGKLAGYKMLVLPSAQALSDDVAALVRKFVADGGILVSTSCPGLYGPDYDTKGTGQLADVIGADFDKFLPMTPVANTPLHTGPKNEAWIGLWGPNKMRDDSGADTMRTVFAAFKPRQGAEVLASYTTGEPAIITNTFGKGKSLVIGYPVGRMAFLSDIYHSHYGHNWGDMPNGPWFAQDVMVYVQSLLNKLELTPEVMVVEETTARPIGKDAGWPTLFWPKKQGDYRSFLWQTSSYRNGMPPRSVDVGMRSRDGNPNWYLTVYDREGAYGYDPGVIEVEAVSKLVRLEIAGHDGLKRLYDLSLGCPVPVVSEPSYVDRKPKRVFSTYIEHSQAKMFVLSDDETIRVYKGNRQRGRSDAQIVSAVEPIAARATAAPAHTVLAADDIAAFLKQRGPAGLVISCESDQYLEDANRLAKALAAKYGGKVRVTRVPVRITGQLGGVNATVEHYTTIVTPDIIIGNRNDSHYLAKVENAFSMPWKHCLALPVITGRHFPGAGRSFVFLSRPFVREPLTDEEERNFKPGPISHEKPAPPYMVIAGSDQAGVKAGVDKVLELAK